MNIEIRSWDKTRYEYSYNLPMELINYTCNKNLNDLFNDDSFVFQRFIGLKDDFRRKIYEGDIVKYTVDYTVEHGDKDIQEFIGEVKYDNSNAMFVFGANEHSMYDRINKIEVIGNLFENPELLNNGI